EEDIDRRPGTGDERDRENGDAPRKHRATVERAEGQHVEPREQEIDPDTERADSAEKPGRDGREHGERSGENEVHDGTGKRDQAVLALRNPSSMVDRTGSSKEKTRKR